MKLFALAAALMMVIEGLMPLINPKGWRRTVLLMQTFNDGQLRFVGAALIILGGIIYAVVSHFGT